MTMFFFKRNISVLNLLINIIYKRKFIIKIYRNLFITKFLI